MYKNIEKQKVLHMAEQVNYQDGQIVSRTLVQNSKLSMTLFAFEKDEEISTHAAGGDAMVTVLEGTGRFTVGGEVFLVSQGETLIHAQGYPPCGVRAGAVQDAVDGVVLKIWCKIHWILHQRPQPAACIISASDRRNSILAV